MVASRIDLDSPGEITRKSELEVLRRENSTATVIPPHAFHSNRHI